MALACFYCDPLCILLLKYQNFSRNIFTSLCLKFEISDQNFRRNIFTLLCLKFEISAHVQLVITCYYKLCTYFLGT